MSGINRIIHYVLHAQLSDLIVLGLDFSLSFSIILALAIVGLQEEETFLE
jgi:hypothetical protein